MSYHYVAKAMVHRQPVVLKIGCDKHLIQNEAKVLKQFNGNGAIELISQNDDLSALLLQQAIPGTTLKSFYPQDLDLAMDAYVFVIQKLHRRELLVPKETSFRYLSS